jgi:putative spermidine/putrescine transport system substrate-binding protein
MKKLSVLFTAALLAGTAFAVSARAGDELTVVSWGGAYSTSQHKAFVEPYIAAGNKVTEAEYNGEVAKIKAMVEAKAVTWDVIDGDSPTTLQACAEGAVETLDWAKLGLDKSKFIGADNIACGIPNIIYGTVFGYDTTKITSNPPTTIQDFFDTAKYPGKRGLWKNPQVNMEWALITDGVDPKDVYTVLGTPEGVDRAFKKLDTIKKDIVWWESGAQAPQLLADGQVLMTSAWNGRLYNAVATDKKPFKIVWDHQALDWDYWMITKETPRMDAAYRFVSFASDAKNMANQTNYISYGPSNMDSVSSIAPDMLPNMPTAPDNLKTAWNLDSQFWADHGDEIKERFNAWLAQ